MLRLTAVAAAVMIPSGTGCIGSTDEHRFTSADLERILAEDDLAPEGTTFDATISGDFGPADVDYYSDKRARRLEKFNFTSGRSVSFMPDSESGEVPSAEGYLFGDSSDAEGYF